MVETEEEKAKRVRERILHVLRIYPVISPTMMQGGMGPYIPPKVWRPVLEELKNEGLVIQEEVPMETVNGRFNTYTKLRLKGTVVTVEGDEVAA